jgi:hypothetical protein
MSDNSPFRTTCHQTPPACLMVRFSLVRMQDVTNVIRCVRFIPSFTFLVRAPAHEHFQRNFRRVRSRLSLRVWTGFQFKIVSV